MKTLSKMRNFQILTTNTFAFVFIIMIGCGSNEQDSEMLMLQFEAKVNGEPLVLGTKQYTNPNGDGTFSIEDFKLYISNIVLYDSLNNRFDEKNSYHLLRFNPQSNVFQFTVDSIALQRINKVSLAIGVDSVRNHNIDNSGDLDPNSQMAWNWSTGYKFLLLEGNYYKPGKDKPIPLVFHVGFMENYKWLDFKLGQSIDLKKDSVMSFVIEINELFKTPNTIYFDSLSSVTFNKQNALKLGNNYVDMITLNVTQ